MLHTCISYMHKLAQSHKPTKPTAHSLFSRKQNIKLFPAQSGNGRFAFDVTHEFWGGNFKNGITSPS